MRVLAQPMLIVALGVGCLATNVIARILPPEGGSHENQVEELSGQAPGKGDPEAAKITNPVAVSPESIAAGKKTYDTACAACHGADARGGLTISVIEDRGGKQPPNLIDDMWDHGSTDGEIFTVTKKGVPPDYFMAPWDGRISDTDIWNTINYIKSLAPQKK